MVGGRQEADRGAGGEAGGQQKYQVREAAGAQDEGGGGVCWCGGSAKAKEEKSADEACEWRVTRRVSGGGQREGDELQPLPQRVRSELSRR
eukprot:2972256-Rhodomonas_salina.1